MKKPKKILFWVSLIIVAIFCLAVAYVAPMIDEAIISCKQPAESADIRQWGIILYSYAQDHDGKLPPNLEALVESGWIDHRDKWVKRSLPKILYFPPDLPWNNNPVDKIILVMHHPGGFYVYRIGNRSEFIRIKHEK